MLATHKRICSQYLHYAVVWWAINDVLCTGTDGWRSLFCFEHQKQVYNDGVACNVHALPRICYMIISCCSIVLMQLSSACTEFMYVQFFSFSLRTLISPLHIVLHLFNNLVYKIHDKLIQYWAFVWACWRLKQLEFVLPKAW